MKRLLSAAAALSLLAGPVLTSSAALADHYVHHNDWHKGSRIGHDDWNRGQHVDYNAHHLHRPPHGYEWRQVDGNFVLAAVATGVIASVIVANH
jgi:Ni/Co efflux regulator RcnB